MDKAERELRRNFIGASEAGALLGVDLHGKSLADLWIAKTATGPLEDDDEGMPAKRGRWLEPGIAVGYAEEHGVDVVKPHPQVHPKYPWMRASPDGLVFSKSGALLCGLEVKTTGLTYASEFGEPGTDQVPLSYIAQCVQGMAVFNLSAWDLAVDIPTGYGAKIEFYRIHRNEEAENALIERGRRFWEEHVLTRIPPPAEWEDQAKIVRALYPKSNGELLRAADSEVLEIMRLQAIDTLLTNAEIEHKKQRTIVEQMIGAADGIQTEDATVTWKSNKDSPRVEWERVARELNASAELISKHTVIKPGPRVFRMNFERGWATKSGGKKCLPK